MQITIEVVCPLCENKEVQRHGKMAEGTPRFRCPLCRRVFMLRPPKTERSADFKKTVLAAYEERSSMRGIARTFGISRNTLTVFTPL